MANASNFNSPQNADPLPAPASAASSTATLLIKKSSSSPFGVNLTQAVSVKLDRNNFLLWKNMILPIVQGHNLEGYILG